MQWLRPDYIMCVHVHVHVYVHMYNDVLHYTVHVCLFLLSFVLPRHSRPSTPHLPAVLITWSVLDLQSTASKPVAKDSGAQMTSGMVWARCIVWTPLCDTHTITALLYMYIQYTVVFVRWMLLFAFLLSHLAIKYCDPFHNGPVVGITYQATHCIVILYSIFTVLTYVQLRYMLHVIL